VAVEHPPTKPAADNQGQYRYRVKLRRNIGDERHWWDEADLMADYIEVLDGGCLGFFVSEVVWWASQPVLIIAPGYWRSVERIDEADECAR